MLAASVVDVLRVKLLCMWQALLAPYCCVEERIVQLLTKTCEICQKELACSSKGVCFLEAGLAMNLAVFSEPQQATSSRFTVAEVV